MLAARTMSEIPYPTKFVIDPIFFGSPELFSCQRRLENDLKRRAKMTQTADSKRQRLCAAYTIAGISAGGVVEIPDLTQRPILRYLEK